VHVVVARKDENINGKEKGMSIKGKETKQERERRVIKFGAAELV